MLAVVLAAGVLVAAAPWLALTSAQAQYLSKGKAASKDGGGAGADSATALSIVALVNDEPITGYEVQQRQKFAGMGANIQGKVQQNFQALIKDPNTSKRLRAILEETVKANEGKSREEILAIFERRKKEYGVSLQKQAVESARRSVLPGLRKNALEELIEEKLKLQEAKRANAVASDDEVKRVIASMAERNKMTEDQFAKHLASMGLDIDTMRQRVRATLSWTDVIRRKFGQQVSISGSEVERLVAKSSGAAEDSVELQLQRIRLSLPARFDQALMANRLAEADRLRSQFTGCSNLNILAGSVQNARLEDLGSKKPAMVPEPTRSLLLSATDSEMLPPSVGEGAVELWAVCGRKVVKGDDQKRQAAEGELKQKEFELLAKRFLKDLRQDASIEMRGGG